MLKMVPLEIGNDDKKTFPIKNLGDLSPLQGHLQESLNLDLEDFMSQNSEVDPLALHHF